ncbi:CLUMA_CG015454, isoform A [Clunio marinus]|uniref:CLUMA_CG015454, isoform A n=1 Tax=Clunio marinus TaxID=568069 RepID=A0A1J1IP94_9DIPT|nr:CLUMA_CG015454, isoform A [Clunio marinus]
MLVGNGLVFRELEYSNLFIETFAFLGTSELIKETLLSPEIIYAKGSKYIRSLLTSSSSLSRIL